MKNITDIKINDRNNKFYYAGWHCIDGNENDIELSIEGDPIDGYAVYEIDKNGLSVWVMDGSEDICKAMVLRFINQEAAIYSLNEAIVDISIHTADKRFLTTDSRLLVSLIIGWANEFETVNAGVTWGVNTELDYLEAIEQFTDIKIRDAIDSEFGYIDTDKQ